METLIIKSQEAFNARIVGSKFEYDGNLRLECPIMTANSIFVSGYIEASGYIKTGGYIEASGYIKTGGSIEAYYFIKAGKFIKAGRYIKAGGSIKAGRYIKVGSSIESRSCIKAGGCIKADSFIKASGSIETGSYIKSGGLIKYGEAIKAKEFINSHFVTLNNIMIERIRFSTNNGIERSFWIAHLQPILGIKELIDVIKNNSWDEILITARKYQKELLEYEHHIPAVRQAIEVNLGITKGEV